MQRTWSRVDPNGVINLGLVAVVVLVTMKFVGRDVIVFRGWATAGDSVNKWHFTQMDLYDNFIHKRAYILLYVRVLMMSSHTAQVICNKKCFFLRHTEQI